MSLFITLLFVKAALTQQTMEVTTDVCDLRLDKSNGNLVGLHWKNPDEEVIKESRLGENFRILLPLPNYEANYFLSTNQKAQFEKMCSDLIDRCKTPVLQAMKDA